jgi:tetratricopeptide (TPR) repeat protein
MLLRLAALCMLAGSAATPACAEWLRAESPNFIAFGEGDEARLRGQVAILEDYAALLRLLSDLPAETPPAPKLRIYFVRRSEDLDRVPPLSSLIPGFYTAASTGIAAFVNAGAAGGTMGANEILFHEYAHHFMMQYHGNAYPAWYVEGFAEYLATTRFTERHIELGRMNRLRSAWLFRRADWLPVETIMFDRAGVTTLEDLSRFYAQSWLITHYMFADGARRAQLVRYLQALGRGEEPRAAFQASFAVAPAEMQRQLVAYSRQGIVYRRIDRASVGRPVQITMTRLPPSADQLLMSEAAMLVGREPSPEEFARILRETERRGDPYARRVLARAEAIYGDGAAAERLLTELLAATPNDAELLYLRGMRHIAAARTAAPADRAAQYRQARSWFSRAHRADPTHFPTLYRYAHAFQGEPEFRSENTLNIMLLAVQLAPQVPEIRMNAARMLLLRGEFALAERLLQPLASTAHSGEQADSARALLELARARNAEGVELSFDPPPEEPKEPAESGSD